MRVYTQEQQAVLVKHGVHINKDGHSMNVPDPVCEDVLMRQCESEDVSPLTMGDLRAGLESMDIEDMLSVLGE
jgi:hypothetical protein